MTDSAPPAKRYYRISPVELAEVIRHLNEYLSKAWIRTSTSPYRAPIIFARKKNGTLRICTDYRALNRQTRPDKHLFPQIDDLLDCLVDSNCLISIDLHTAYYWVAICPGDEYKKAFLSRYSLFKLLVLPFVIKNTPSTS